jgi:hypothetical protein
LGTGFRKSGLKPVFSIKSKVVVPKLKFWNNLNFLLFGCISGVTRWKLRLVGGSVVYPSMEASEANSRSKSARRICGLGSRECIAIFSRELLKTQQGFPEVP